MDTSSWPATFNAAPDRIERFRELISRATENRATPFRGTKDVFFAAAALARLRGLREPLKGKEALGRMDSFQLEDFIVALAIANDADTELTVDGKDVVAILEQRANAGIDELYEAAMKDSEQVVNVGDFLVELLSGDSSGDE